MRYLRHNTWSKDQSVNQLTQRQIENYDLRNESNIFSVDRGIN